MNPVPADGWQAGFQWAACGASVTGQEHERRGLGCDDAYGYGIAGDFVVASVADGAGSVTGTSAWGAYAACQSVLRNALRPDFIDHYHSSGAEDAERLVRGLFGSALEAVTRQADSLGLEPALLSTTLCVGVADHSRAVFGQIGDGVIAAERGGQVESLLIEQKADYANTTCFLQSERALDCALRIAVRGGDVTAFALSTDGMSYKITNVATGDAYEPFFRDSWQHVRSGASAGQFAALLRSIEEDQTGDDKTMVLVAARPGPYEADSGPPALIMDCSPAPGRYRPIETPEVAPVDTHGDTGRRRRRRRRRCR